MRNLPFIPLSKISEEFIGGKIITEG